MSDIPKFIRTDDQTTANTFTKHGLHMMPKQGKYWMFVNEPFKMTFEYDTSKVSYTNKLNI